MSVREKLEPSENGDNGRNLPLLIVLILKDDGIESEWEKAIMLYVVYMLLYDT